MTKLLLIFVLALNLAYAVDHSRIGFTANPMQNGDAFEIEYTSKSFFKLKDKSIHDWGIFASVGTLTYSNVLLKDETKVEEVISPEVTFGIMAHANFYKDFIYQYGKIGADIIIYDSKVHDSTGVGALLETGIELKSDKRALSFHTGFRWRLGLPAASEIAGEPDPFEGLSMVFGGRYQF